MTARPLPDVRVGQIWEDCDKRCDGRTIKVIQLLEDGRVLCQVGHAASLRTKIRRERFRPTANGYKLLRDVSEVPHE